MKRTIKTTPVFLAVVLVVLSVTSLLVFAGTESGKTISYSFSNTKAGYAEGTITFTSDSSGDYKLYWADDAGKLSGFYSIKKFSFSSAGSKTYSFGYHTAIPSNATRVIALDSSGNTVAEYLIPVNKRLSGNSGNLRYKFNAYSDLHININGYFKKATERWEKGLQYGVETNTDFIVITGDAVTNGGDPASEWKSYEKTLKSSAISFDETQLLLADVNESGGITVKDVIAIQRLLSETIADFSSENSSPKESVASVGATDYKKILDDFYTFSSYDQYQALKKLYYYGGSQEELSAAAAELKIITDHINGTSSGGSTFDTYYFENTKDWSNVCAYAWNGSTKNKEWPGEELSKVGTNSGHDVYKVKFDSAGQYSKIIFNSGSNAAQTVDIELSSYSQNAFYISGKDSDGKYTVGSFSFTQ